ncbi:hypothetical protein QZH41_005617 [Actinostola sp. cb2023]|nr:hypothetical protein QZH41_005617 [Actinostola sp. cb2023]
MLEYGGGPNISRLITACTHVQDIIFAEYLEANRKVVEDWVAKDPKAFNWRPAFEFVVQKIEGKATDEVDKRESEVRDKIRAIVPCDVKAANPLQIPDNLSTKYGPPFDVVSTSLCLEAVVESEQEYKDHVAFLAKMLRPGGYLMMHGVLEQTFYTVGEKFYTFPLTREMVLDSMKDAGLKDVVIDLASSHFPDEAFNELPLADLKDLFLIMSFF